MIAVPAPTSILAAATGLEGITIPLAFLAGLASFVSPCVLPLVPAYMAYLGTRAAQPVPAAVGPGPGAVQATAVGTGVQMPVVYSGVAFVAGLSLVFILFFYALYIVVQPVAQYVPRVAGVLVIIMAAQFAGFIRIPFLMGEYRVMKQAPTRGGVVGGFLLGMGFASGWTPCIGATLGAVLTSAVTVGTTTQGLVLMVAYCLGLGLPFILMAFAVERARPIVRAINDQRRAVELGSAAVLLVMGLLLLTNQLTWLSIQFSHVIPTWLQPQL